MVFVGMCNLFCKPRSFKSYYNFIAKITSCYIALLLTDSNSSLLFSEPVLYFLY